MIIGTRLAAARHGCEMCGIAGIVSFDGNPERLAPSRLDAMGRALAHRGPDGAGVYVDASTPGIGLVHRRLSIIDLEGGSQPLGNEDDTVLVSFNGEIFNYVELGQALVARGHRFKTKTDTEVLAHLYEEMGDQFVHELNGQFAIALWDVRRRRLLLVRDRPGILPLYFLESGGELLFGSEIKAILSAMTSPPRIHPDALRDVMTFWAPLSPATLFEGIVEVAPGEILIVEDGHARRQTYWKWHLTNGEKAPRGSECDQVEELRSLLADAARLRLRADVEVGAFLSGGLDSSMLVSLMSRELGTTLRTFSIAFDDPALDETQYQRLVVDAIASRHSQLCCSTDDMALRFQDVIRATEVPLTRTGPVAMHALSSHVRSQGCKVVLTGEGADEVLGGYDLFKEAKVRAFCARQRSSTRRPRLLQRLYPSFDFTRKQPASLLAAYFVAPNDDPADLAFSHRTRWAAGPIVEELLTPDFRAQCSPVPPADRAVNSLGPDLEGLDLVQRAQLLEARTLLPSYILCSQSDRMLMAHSVEGRFPYLDHRVIEFANRLDPRLKIRVLNEKFLLKRAAEGLVPAPIVRRPKQPYRGPDATIFLGPRRPQYVTDLLAPAAVARTGYFQPQRVEQLTRKVEAAARDRRPVSHRDSLSLMTVLSTQVWHTLFQTTRGWV